jgi:serine O-acetyltransferase
VVVKNVPSGATAVGNPARIIDNEQDQKREQMAGQLGFSAYALAANQDDPLGQGDSWLARSCGRKSIGASNCCSRSLKTLACMSNGDLATAARFDPQYLSKIVD